MISTLFTDPRCLAGSNDTDARNQEHANTLPSLNWRVVTVQIDPNEVPQSPKNIPRSLRSWRLPLSLANSLATALNNQALGDPKRRSKWYAVTKGPRGGYFVLRLVIPHDWKPVTERDLPDAASPAPMTLRTAQAVARVVNELTLRRRRSGAAPWAIPICELSISPRLTGD